MSQSMAFIGGEGDAWYERNRHSNLNPLVTHELTKLEVKPRVILEIGCGSGRYLNEIYNRYQCHCIGYDPSRLAIAEGRKNYPNLDLRYGSVRAFSGLLADIIVFGFCLYLVDREDLFHLVKDADWSLPTGGHIIVHDFDISEPQVVPYSHKPGIFTYKMDYAALWSANPVYELISKKITADGEAVTILRKGKWDRWQV